jgi:hypothetical protein
MLLVLPLEVLFLPPCLGDEALQLSQLPRGGILRLQEAQDHLIEGTIEDFVEKSPRHLLPAMAGGVNKRSPYRAVFNQPLLLHNAEKGLHGVEMRFAMRIKALVYLSDTGFSQLPQNFEYLELTFAWSDLSQISPPVGCRILT